MGDIKIFLFFLFLFSCHDVLAVLPPSREITAVELDPDLIMPVGDTVYGCIGGRILEEEFYIASSTWEVSSPFVHHITSSTFGRFDNVTLFDESANKLDLCKAQFAAIPGLREEDALRGVLGGFGGQPDIVGAGQEFASFTQGFDPFDPIEAVKLEERIEAGTFSPSLWGFNVTQKQISGARFGIREASTVAWGIEIHFNRVPPNTKLGIFRIKLRGFDVNPDQNGKIAGEMPVYQVTAAIPPLTSYGPGYRNALLVHPYMISQLMNIEEFDKMTFFFTKSACS